jgi:pantetheine-phosphate adenylyltransferase
MDKIAVFPGSFDPFTVGHKSIVMRGLSLFDKIIIAIGYNSNKSGFIPLTNRIKMINDIFRDEENILVDSYMGLTVEYCQSVKGQYILRGLRTAADFEYERAIAQVNKSMAPEIESVFILTTPEYTPINSSIVRDIIRHDGDASRFIPENINYKNYLPGT